MYGVSAFRQWLIDAGLEGICADITVHNIQGLTPRPVMFDRRK